MTYSIGCRAPRRNALAAELVQHLTQHATDDVLYADERAAATAQPARLPRTLQEFAQNAVRTLSERPAETSCALGEILTEVKPGVLFDEPAGRWANGAVVLDRRTRMLYDERHVFINGDSVRATGEDARLMRTLADHRGVDARAVRAASAAARTLLAQWFRAGWLHAAAGVEAERGVDHAAADPDTDMDAATDPADGQPPRA
jgi:50S ribosomal protein L16 3-hydroxylase